MGVTDIISGRCVCARTEEAHGGEDGEDAGQRERDENERVDATLSIDCATRASAVREMCASSRGASVGARASQAQKVVRSPVVASMPLSIAWEVPSHVGRAGAHADEPLAT